MIKETLTLLNNKPNIFDFPQATIDSFKIDDSDFNVFLSTAKIFLEKSRNHFTSKYVEYHTDNDFKYIDIIKYSKYPLPTVYNKQTKRLIINLSALGKVSVSNISPRDVYTLVVCGRICAFLSAGVQIPPAAAGPFAEYLIQMLLKIFSKKYGLTGQYVDKIPQFRFFTSLYVYTSFFGVEKNLAIKHAAIFSKVNPKKLQVDLSKYDFMQIDSYLSAMSENAVT